MKMKAATILRTAALTAAFCMTLADAALAQTFFPPDSTVNAILSDRVARKRAMGLVVATFEQGKEPRIYTAGVSGIAGLPLDGNTLFEVGSITKVFTNTILADMVKKGEVRLDDPVAKFLPARVHVPERDGKKITLVDLATQSSGLPRLPNNLNPADATNPYADYTITQLYEFLSSYVLPRDI